MKYFLLIVYICNCFLLFPIKCHKTEHNNDNNHNDTIVLVAEEVSTNENVENSPAGIHVNINLLNGKEKAKIIDAVDDDNNANDRTKEPINKNQHQNNIINDNLVITVVDNNNNNNNKNNDNNNDNTSTIEAISQRNEKIPESLAISYEPDKDMDKLRQKYKSYKELKKSFDSIRRDFQTDAEIILQLLDKFKNITKKSKGNAQVRSNLQMKILYNLNYLISQIDNAVLFADKGGLEHILLPIIVNSTDVNVRVEAMRVLAAMTQNNPPVQIKVFERNFGPYLIQILMTSTNTEELSTALSAISSLLRKFPYAQLKLLPTSGIQALITLLAKDCEMKIKAKVVTIISDMIVEKNLILMENATNTGDPLAATQYESLNYAKWLQDHSYCDTMDMVITNNVHQFWDAPDLMEYFMYCIDNTRTICSTYWSQNAQFQQNLLTLQQHYTEINDEYHIEVAELIANISKKIYEHKTFTRHDEF